MKLSDILYESKNKLRFIIQGAHGIGHYEVWENVGTNSKRKATIHFSNDTKKSFERAKVECNKEFE